MLCCSFPSFIQSSDHPKKQLPSLITKGFLNAGFYSGKRGKTKKKHSRPYSPPKPVEDPLTLISEIDAAIAEKWKRLKGKKAAEEVPVLDDLLCEGLYVAFLAELEVSDQKYLSNEEMGAIQSFAAKYPVKQSAR